MYLKIETQPQTLTTQLNQEERNKRVTLFDLKVKQEQNASYLYEMDLVLQNINLDKTTVYKLLGKNEKVSIGCKGVEIDITLTNQQVREYATGKTVSVKYQKKRETKETDNYKASLGLTPKDRPVELGKGTSKGEEHLTELSLDEKELKAISTNNSVKWQYHMFDVENIGVDYLFCNLPLFVKSQASEDQCLKGDFSIKPKNMGLFGEDGRHIGRLSDMSMILFLIMKKEQRLKLKLEDTRGSFEASLTE